MNVGVTDGGDDTTSPENLTTPNGIPITAPTTMR